ncbi:hypothetical protein GCM10010211_68880 [Streptomyces albospinus]|uniref:Serine/threonine protein kinase n=1 Tax=Streptomyces albospinus TaxID=285515 RepID=A0ABQ2VLM1_9ACTN|nr:hypothetical protein [Streptomyces albospinus]GGU92331.1 hypothetical protein GCM10010211_68880 [Streptomyces albospinus]
MQRARILRLTGLAGTAVLALVVPLAAATAGPVDTFLTSDAPGASAERPAGKAASADTGAGHAKTARRAGAPRGPADPLADLGLPLLSGARTTHCGPELTAPQGVTAQTCVLAENGRTWGRTYYRNTTGEDLRAVLTLLRPDGRTVQVNCEVPAGDAPGVCETPSGATVRKAGLLYGAVAEISDAAGERLLLRSGGNSAPGGGDSGPGGTGGGR